MGTKPSKYRVETQSSNQNYGVSDARNQPMLDGVESSRTESSSPGKRRFTDRFFRSNVEPSSPKSRIAAKIALAVLLSTILLVLVIFLFLHGSSHNDNGDEEDRREEEGSNANKLPFATVWMLLSTVGLSIMGCIAFWDNLVITMPSRYRTGMLGGALLGFASMAIICIIFFWNLQVEEEASGDRQLESQDQQEEEQEQVEISKPFCIFCAVLAIVCSVFGVLVIWKHHSIISNVEKTGPDPTGTVSADDGKLVRSAAKADVLKDVWNAMCLLAICSLLASAVVAPLALLREDAERKREDGAGLWNFIAIIFWLLLSLVVLFIMGRNIFGTRKSSSQVTIGVFNGLLYMFAAASFLVAVFYTSYGVRQERRREDDSLDGSGGFSVVCFLFAGAFGAFAVGVTKHHKAVIRTNAKDIYSVEQWREPFMCAELT